MTSFHVQMMLRLRTVILAPDFRAPKESKRLIQMYFLKYRCVTYDPKSILC